MFTTRASWACLVGLVLAACSAETTSESPERGAGGKADSPPCQTDDACPDSHVCDVSACIQSCGGEIFCENHCMGECVAEVGAALCGNPDDCGSDETCSFDVCHPNPNCEAGQPCTQACFGECVAAGSDEGPIGEEAAECLGRTHCDPGFFCEFEAAGCSVRDFQCIGECAPEPEHGFCRTDQDCAGNCDLSECLPNPACTSVDTQPCSSECWGVCEPPPIECHTGTNGGCPAGLTCDVGDCGSSFPVPTVCHGVCVVE